AVHVAAGAGERRPVQAIQGGPWPQGPLGHVRGAREDPRRLRARPIAAGSQTVEVRAEAPRATGAEYDPGPGQAESDRPGWLQVGGGKEGTRPELSAPHATGRQRVDVLQGYEGTVRPLQVAGCRGRKASGVLG